MLDIPLLLGVKMSNQPSLTLRPYGYRDDVSPDWMAVDMEPWIFDGADFSTQPFFAAYTDY